MSIEQCEKYTATLSEILAITPAVQTVADATDVPGVRLEWMKTTENPTGAWFGDLGTMSKATADALYASGALANLATGATYRDTSGTQYTYSAGAGWVDSSIRAFTRVSPASNLYCISAGGVLANGVCERFVCDVPFWGFRVKFMNQGASAGTVVASKWSIATSLFDAGTTSQVNAKSLKVSGSDIASTATPSGGASQSPVWLASDMVLQDFPAGTIIEVRTNTTGMPRNTQNPGSGDILPAGISHKYASVPDYNTDVLTGNPAKLFSLANAGTVNGMCMIEFYTYDKKFVVTAVGDSLTQGIVGATGGGGTASPVFMAAQLNPKISPCNYGFGGRSLFSSIAVAKQIIANANIDAILVHAWSPNDGTSDETCARSIGETIDLINYANKYNVRAMVCTPFPWSYTGVNLTNWQKMVAAVRALNGCIIVDITAELEDPANPGNLKPEYFGSALDSMRLHPSPEGKLAQARVIAAAANLL